MQNFKKLTKYKFLKNIVIRVAKRPIGLKNGSDIDDLLKILYYEGESIYLSSKDFYAEIAKETQSCNSQRTIDKHSKLLKTGYSYISRMTFRTTPFGLFAGCGVIKWGVENNVKINGVTRYTKLDARYLYELILSIENEYPALKKQLFYWPNSTLYRLSNMYKFYTNNESNEPIIAKLEKSFELNEILKLSAKGAKIGELCVQLFQFGYSYEESFEFVKKLIDIGFLESELHLPLMQRDNLTYYNELLQKYDCQEDVKLEKKIGLLKKTQAILIEMDKNLVNPVKTYMNLTTELRSLFSVPASKRSDFNVELSFNCAGSTLNSKLKRKLKKGIWAINKFVDNRDYDRVNRLEKFKQRFKQKFGSESVLLTTALDLDVGVDYNSFSTEMEKEKSHVQGTNNRYLHKLLLDSLDRGEKTIRLDRRQLQRLKSVSGDLPKMIAIQFSLIPNKNDFIHLKYIWNTPGVDIVNRFSLGNNEIKEVADSLSKLEEQFYSDAIIFEVLHAPNPSVLNISTSEIINQYYIQYQCNQSSGQDNLKMDLSDINICVLEDELVLYSKKYKKRVIPRINNLVSPDHYKLPLIKFLLDFSIGPFKRMYCYDWIVNWNVFSHFNFLPRVEYDDVIISPAIWRLRSNEVKDYQSFSSFNEYRLQRDIPRFVIYRSVDGSGMHLDLLSEISWEILKSHCKKYNVLVLNESLSVESIGMVRDFDNNQYASESFAFLSSEPPPQPFAYPSPLREVLACKSGIKHTFLPGEEWLFYKIYCNEHDANQLLIYLGKTVINSLLKDKLIEKYFFIRYTDPDFHIRLRLFVSNSEKLGEIIRILNEHVRSNTLVRKILLDTYEREVLRYGKETIHHAEELFYIDSKFTIKLLDLSRNKGEEFFYTMIVALTISLLEDFGYDNIKSKERVIRILAESYQKEFDIEEPGRFKRGKHKGFYKIAKKYVKGRKQDGMLKELRSIVNNKSRENKQIIQEISKALIVKQESIACGDSCQNSNIYDTYIHSYIHMMLNRILPSNPRWNEMVVYTILNSILKES